MKRVLFDFVDVRVGQVELFAEGEATERVFMEYASRYALQKDLVYEGSWDERVAFDGLYRRDVLLQRQEKIGNVA